MHDRELYRQILGIQAPWGGAEVQVDLRATGVTVLFEALVIDWLKIGTISGMWLRSLA